MLDLDDDALAMVANVLGADIEDIEEASQYIRIDENLSNDDLLYGYFIQLSEDCPSTLRMKIPAFKDDLIVSTGPDLFPDEHEDDFA